MTKRQPEPLRSLIVPILRIQRLVDELDYELTDLDSDDLIKALTPYLDLDKVDSVIAALSIVADVHADDLTETPSRIDARGKRQ